mmetsp:Transcript_162819/g.517275  ORF Transcript_162819/g.517275 Transcript_162819/m.517275 type:complete len:210 (+) Transcript_162819:147-776(+)
MSDATSTTLSTWSPMEIHCGRHVEHGGNESSTADRRSHTAERCASNSKNSCDVARVSSRRHRERLKPSSGHLRWRRRRSGRGRGRGGLGTRLARCADGLALHVQGLALQRPPVDGHEAADMKRLASRQHALDPSLDVLVAALAVGAGPLGHHPAACVLHQRVLPKAAHRLLLAAPQDERLRQTTLRDLRDTLGLHDFRAAGRLAGERHS